MKRPIKFRGRRSDNGELVYGSYCHEVYRDLGTLHAIIDEGGEEFIVEEDSIAQLVGYDQDGNEVYEGDELTGNYEGVDIEYVARLKAYANSSHPTGVIRFRFDNLTLKEAEA